MAKQMNGILGPISGKLGPVIGSTWKGTPYLRAVGAKTEKQPTPAQLVVRAKFKMASDVIKHLMPFVSLGYASYKRKLTQRNVAMKHILSRAIEGVYPDFRVDYSKVQLAEGTLPGILQGAIGADEPATLTIRWVYDVNDRSAKPNHYLMAAVYAPELGQSVVRTTLELREKEEAKILLPQNFSGQQVHVWTAFVDLDSMMKNSKPEAVSNSTYLGSVTIL